MSFKITDRVLDKLGFSEYWDENGDWGGRTLVFSNDIRLRISDHDEKDDDTDGYTSWGTYQPQYYMFHGWFATPEVDAEIELVFLEDLHRVIKEFYPECEQEFIDKCTSLRMQWGLIGAGDRYGK